MFRLTVIEGSEAGRSVEVRDGSLSIGKSPSNQLALSDPFVSRHHGQILWQGRHYVYLDLQSSNGSAVRRADRLIPAGPEQNYRVRLENGDLILLGDQSRPTSLSFEVAAESGQPEAGLQIWDFSAGIKNTTIVGSWKEIEEGLKSDARTLDALYRLTRSLTGAGDDQDLFRILAAALFEAFPPATHALLAEVDLGVAVLDARQGGRAADPSASRTERFQAADPGAGRSVVKLLMARARDRPEEKLEDLPLSRSLIAKALREETGIHFSNLPEITPTSPSLLDASIYSGILVPIRRVQSRPCVLQVDNRGGGRPFTNKDLEVLTVFSVHAAGILDLLTRIEALTASTSTLISENIRLKLRIRSQAVEPDEMVGVSPAMQEIYRQLEKLADLPTTVLIRGETGTGKELVARALHYNSRLRTRPFVAQNCAALPETLLDSELFGHRKGAFTGALEDRRGLFELADGGTLFLDELSEMAPPTQARLLRVLQDGVFRRLGEEKERRCRVRVIGATNKDLHREVEEGRFRRDLYYRLNTIVLAIPPLRERAEDIPVLCDHLLARIARKLELARPVPAPEVLEVLSRHPYPGNVRELENILENLVIQAAGQRLEPRHLPAYLREGPDAAAVTRTPATADELKEARESVCRDLETRFVRKLLKDHRGVVTAAAEAAGMNRSQFHQMLSRLGIEPDPYRSG